MSAANSSLVGILITIGDVTNIFAIANGIYIYEKGCKNFFIKLEYKRSVKKAKRPSTVLAV